MSEQHTDALGRKTLLVGPEIPRYCGVTQATLYRWIKQHAFPAGKLPNGKWCTSPGLIDAWLLTRNPYHRAILESHVHPQISDATCR
jgi:hypothetical protein